MTRNSNTNHCENYLNYSIVFVFCLILFFCFPFFINGIFCDWSESGAFGDTYGALNALFSGLAFAGLIVTISIQRKELRLQREEITKTGKEQLLNRTTHFVYNQLERFENSLKELTIVNEEKTYTGYQATLFLYKVDNMQDEEHNIEMKKSIEIFLNLCSSNRASIELFARNAGCSINVLKRLIYTTDLEVEQLNGLKNLFFDNIGFVNMEVIRYLSEYPKKELEFNDGYSELSGLFGASAHFKRIKKFFSTKLDRDNFEELKKEWKDKLGSRE